MSQTPELPATAGSWLERKLATLYALYHRFGREGLKDQPIAEVGLLLTSKELQFRDAAKGRDLGEEQKAANRQLELEIKDLTAYVKGQVAGLTLDNLRSLSRFDRPQLQFKEKGRDQGIER